ncbi:hypothetical protein ACQJBY_027004 [Aegilops geniculata]
MNFVYVCYSLLGLDAFQAEKVMETLRQLAEDGHTVICSIHQPRGSVYSKFDELCYSEGEVVYMGPAKEEPLKYFASLGYQCPGHENPAEFLADLISTDYSSAESVQSSHKRVENLIDDFANKVLITEFNSPVTQSEGSEFSSKLAQKSTSKQRRGSWRQFRLLFKRAWMQVFHKALSDSVFQLFSYFCLEIR